MGTTIETNALKNAPNQLDYEREAYRECLESLFRQTPGSIVSHLVASAFVVYALLPVVPVERIMGWWLILFSIALIRLLANAACLRRWPLEDAALTRWSRFLGFLMFAQMLTWGLSTVMIWPDDISYRSFLVVVLAGVVAAGGIILSVHRNSFLIYCFPVLIPTVWQLFGQGGRLEAMLGALMILYSVVLIFAINRLGHNFISGLVLRLQMQALSRTDPLTGLANRRGFDEYLHDTWQNAVRSNLSIGLIVADIDFFKGYNDAYGHPMGDEALKALADIFHQVAVRTTDLCARVGGEEFAIILPSTDIEGTRRVAEHIQSALAQSPIPHAKSPLGRITVSIGMNALVPGKSDDMDSFYANADKALYAAKNSGRNRIEVALGVRSAA